MQVAESVEHRSQMLDRLEERERRLHAFSADTDLMEAALEAGDIQKAVRTNWRTRMSLFGDDNAIRERVNSLTIC